MKCTVVVEYAELGEYPKYRRYNDLEKTRELAYKFAKSKKVRSVWIIKGHGRKVTDENLLEEIPGSAPPFFGARKIGPGEILQPMIS